MFWYSTISKKYLPVCFLLLTCFLFSLCLYWDLLFGGMVIAFRDTHTILLPMEHIARTLLQDSWLPLWNPFAVLGKPFLAEPLSGVLYPPNWIIRLFPDPVSYAVSISFHHVVAGVSAFIALQHFGFNYRSAIIAALVFSFGGTAVSCDNMINALQSFAWYPLTVWAFASWLSCRETLRMALVALLISLTLLGGMPEVVIFEYFTFIVLLLLGYSKQSESTALKYSTYHISQLILLTLLWFAMSAVFLIPFMEYVMLSDRAAGLSGEKASLFSFHPGRLPGFLFPEYLEGGIRPDSLFKMRALNVQYSVNWAVSIYIGPLLLLLSLSFPKGALRRGWILMVAGVVTLLLTFGSYFPPYQWLITELPFLRVARYPEKFLVLVHAFLCVGIAVGYQALERDPGHKHKLSSGLLLVAVFLIVLAFTYQSSELLFTAAGTAFLGLASLFRHHRILTVSLISAFFLFDTYRIHAHYLPTLQTEALHKQTALHEKIDSQGKSPVRIYSNQLDLHDNSPFPESELRWQRLLHQSMAFIFDLANLNTPSSINLRDHNRLIRLFIGANKNCSSRILGAYGVRYVTSYRKLLGYKGLKVVHESKSPRFPGLYLVENASPLLYVARQVRTVSSDTEVLDAICSSTPDQAVFTNSQPEVSPSNSGSANIQTMQSDMIQAEVALEHDGIVVFNQSFYPGWKVYVDGVEKPVLRVNQFVNGVRVPSGRHKVVFHFLPRSVLIGLGISIATLLGLLLLVCRQVLKGFNKINQSRDPD